MITKFLCFSYIIGKKEALMKKKLWTITKLLIVIIILFMAGCLIMIQFTCVPVTKLTRMGFSGGKEGVQYTHHPEYEQRIQTIEEKLDVSYASAYDLHTYDIYYPKEKGSYPLLLWVHGGAFVGGDKADTRTYMEMVASYGYTVISMNYALAPEQKYPTPVYQMMELLEDIQTKDYPIDFQNIFIGGDSAGAHIAGEFTTLQINPQYQEFTGIKACLKPQQIKGFLSFCGLLDIKAYDDTDSWLSNFLFDQSAWAYFDDKHWETSSNMKQADFMPWITSSFPPTLLTDGNTNFFMKQAEAMDKCLKDLHVSSKLLTYDNDLPHEYQFQLERTQAIETFQEVISFLNKQAM